MKKKPTANGGRAFGDNERNNAYDELDKKSLTRAVRKIRKEYDDLIEQAKIIAKKCKKRLPEAGVQGLREKAVDKLN